MIDPVWKLARRSLVAGVRNGDLKEPCFAEKRVGAVAWSRALYQSPNHRLKDRIVFAVVQAGQWTLQRLHDDELCMPFLWKPQGGMGGGIASKNLWDLLRRKGGSKGNLQEGMG